MIMQADGGQASRNPNGSTGPRTAEGKERVKYNAVRHGLSARNVLLPGEDPAEYQARIDGFKQDLGTRNRIEDELIEKAVQASWAADRAIRSETAWLTARMLTEPAEQALKLTLEADSLFQRLMFDRRGPTELYASREYDHKQPRTSASGEPVDLDRPSRVVAQLEATLPGCQVLLKTWGELGGLLRTGRGWQSPDKLKAIRLLGYQPIDAASLDEVAVIFLAAHVIEPQSRYPFQELRCEIGEEQFKQIKARIERRELGAITPKDATAARAVLLEIVDRAIERLKALLAKHQKVADQLEALQPDILRRDRSKFGDGFYRLLGGCDRSQHRHLDAIHKLRRNEAQGWGTVRSERQQKRDEKRRAEERRLAIEADPRLVVDEHGTVRYAYDYDGDVEAGLARHAERFKPYAAAQADAASGAAGAMTEDGGKRADSAEQHVALKEPRSGVGDVATQSVATREGGISGSEGGIAEPRSGVGDVSTQSVATREGGDSVAEGRISDPVIVGVKGEGANVQNEVTRIAGTEDGRKRAEESEQHLSLDGPRSGVGDVPTQSVETREGGDSVAEGRLDAGQGSVPGCEQTGAGVGASRDGPIIRGSLRDDRADLAGGLVHT